MFHVLLPEHTQYYNNIPRRVLGRSITPRGERDPGNRLKALREKDKYQPSVGGSSSWNSPEGDLGITLLLLQKNVTNYRTNSQQNRRQLIPNGLTSQPLYLEARSKFFAQEKDQENLEQGLFRYILAIGCVPASPNLLALCGAF